MKNNTFLLLYFCFFSLAPTFSFAQMITVNAYLKGRFLEAGINQKGGIGADDPPGGFHGCSDFGWELGIIADLEKDGWTSGVPVFYGDYISSHIKEEGFGIQVDNQYTLSSTSAWPLPITGMLASHYSADGKDICTWFGDFKNLFIYQKVSLDTNKLFLLFEIKMTNKGKIKMNNVFYSRFVNPNNKGCILGGAYTLKNYFKLDNQLPNIKNYTTVSATEFSYRAWMGLHTQDCRAKAFINTKDIYRPPYRLDTLYNNLKSPSLLKMGAGDTVFGDYSMGLVFNVGSIDSGETKTLSFAYVLDKNEIDDVFSKPKWVFDGKHYNSMDTLRVCDSGSYTIGISSTGSSAWTWEPSPYLSASTGSGNNFLAKGTQTFKAWRSDSTVCSGFDTIKIVIITDSFKAPVYASGSVLYTSGLYKSYQWHKDGIAISGATDSFLKVIDTGNYSILVEGWSGCKFFTDDFYFSPASIQAAYLKKGGIIAYPSPTTGKIYLNVPSKLSISVRNLNGTELLKQQNITEIDLKDLPAGIYLLVLFDRNGDYIDRVKVEKK